MAISTLRNTLLTLRLYPRQRRWVIINALEAETLIAYAATFNGEQDVYFVRVGDCRGRFRSP
ncbi:MAG: hypothetical protein NZL85_08340, partial [Fimbriimonadales bacterium]|nr:hypothetical protein [Fimbriimonadales bacterium]